METILFLEILQKLIFMQLLVNLIIISRDKSKKKKKQILLYFQLIEKLLQA